MLSIKRPVKFVGVFLALFLLSLGSAGAASARTSPLYVFHAVAHIPNWDGAACYDIPTVEGGTLYLADDTNAAVTRIAGTSVSFIGHGLFQGPQGCHEFDFSTEGPTGTLVEHGLLWAGDGNSTVKVFDLATGALKATVATGPASANRADELEYIPTTNQVVIANPDASPHPYLTYINASTFKVVAKQVFATATAGLEQPRYAYGLLFQAVPATTANPGGEIDVINPFTRNVLHVYPTPNCGASGLAIIGQEAATGCANGPSEIVNLLSGKVTIVPAGAASDMVASDAARGRFFFADYGSATLIVTDTAGKVIQTIATDAGAHSVAVDESSGAVFVPVGSSGGVVEYTRI